MSSTRLFFVTQMNTIHLLLLSGLLMTVIIFSPALFAEQVDELNTLDDAMAFVLSGDRVPNASEVKLKEIHATYTDEIKVWEFTFIHANATHKIRVDQKKRIQLDSSEDKDAYNEVFWADRPRAEGMFKQDWLYNAENIITSNNYVLTSPTILNFIVCEPPAGDTKSEYSNGCKEDTYKETWSIARGVKGRKLAKLVTYGDGQLDSFSNVTVEISNQ